MNNLDMSNPVIQRYYDLLVDQCTIGLDSDGWSELTSLQQQLLKQYPDHDWLAAVDDIALAVAEVDRAQAPEIDAPMPSGMLSSIEQAIEAQDESFSDNDVLDLTNRLAEKKAVHQSNRTQWYGWYAAAAALAAAIYFGAESPRTPNVPALAEQRTNLIQESDALLVDWGTPTIDGYQQVSGDVVWDNDKQQGFMRLVNLPVNDPSQSQYQLWIVDPARDKNPIDGGVFDVTSEGEVLIPIDSKLPVISPAAFAITREQPGGVVVSAGPLLVVAAVEA